MDRLVRKGPVACEEREWWWWEGRGDLQLFATAVQVVERYLRSKAHMRCCPHHANRPQSSKCADLLSHCNYTVHAPEACSTPRG